MLKVVQTSKTLRLKSLTTTTQQAKTVEKPNKPTEKRVNNVPVEVEFNFTKRLEGRELKANEFSFVLKDSEGKDC